MRRQKWAVEAALFLPLLLAIGCGPGSASEVSQNPSSCVPNQTLMCACPDGSQGARVCTQAGVLTDCQCNSMLAYNAGSGSVAPVVTPTVNNGVAGAGDVPPTDPPADTTTTDPPADPPADTTTTDPSDNTAVACLLPNSVPNISLVDVNSLSPTYNQTRNLDDVCDKVVLIFYTLFH
jgi:hypothetical protein